MKETSHYDEIKEKIDKGEHFMIRKLRKTDINRIAEIWLDTNIKAHHFISAQYWKDNFETVKEMLVQAEVYVYEDTQKIQGFIGLMDDYIAGIFVCSEAQSCGIGRQLLDFVKKHKQQLRLSVYQKNIRAIKFYQRENFIIQSEHTDKHTGEKEYIMLFHTLCRHQSSPQNQSISPVPES